MIDGNGFADTIYDILPYPSSVDATWNNRNRLLEDAIIPRWDGANVTPEAGQTTLLRIVDGSGTVLDEFAGLTGNSYTIPASSFGPGSNWVEFWAERDGLRSLQCARRRVVIGDSGWDYGWNYNWGE